MKLLVLPFISAFIGWLTNYIAIKMIFRPLEPVTVLGVTIQGIAPKRRYDIAESIGSLVANDLVMLTDVTGMVEKLGVSEAVDQIINQAGERIRDRFAAMLPAASLISEEMFEDFKTVIKEEVHRDLHLVTGHVVAGLRENVDIRGIVVNRLAGYDYEKLEELALQLARRELKLIEWLGAALGFFIGIVQVGILVLF